MIINSEAAEHFPSLYCICNEGLFEKFCGPCSMGSPILLKKQEGIPFRCPVRVRLLNLAAPLFLICRIELMWTFRQIAEMEFDRRLLMYTLRRTLSDGR